MSASQNHTGIFTQGKVIELEEVFNHSNMEVVYCVGASHVPLLLGIVDDILLRHKSKSVNGQTAKHHKAYFADSEIILYVQSDNIFLDPTNDLRRYTDHWFEDDEVQLVVMAETRPTFSSIVMDLGCMMRPSNFSRNF